MALEVEQYSPFEEAQGMATGIQDQAHALYAAFLRMEEDCQYEEEGSDDMLYDLKRISVGDKCAALDAVHEMQATLQDLEKALNAIP